MVSSCHVLLCYYCSTFAHFAMWNACIEGIESTTGHWALAQPETDMMDGRARAPAEQLLYVRSSHLGVLLKMRSDNMADFFF